MGFDPLHYRQTLMLMITAAFGVAFMSVIANLT
jgi:hypothetical protein